MSGLVRLRHRWRRLAVRLAIAGVAAALTATLAAGLQVHAIRVTGAHRFRAAEVEKALRFALGAQRQCREPAGTALSPDLVGAG